MALNGVRFRFGAKPVHSKDDVRRWLMPFHEDRTAQYWNLEGQEVVQVPEDQEPSKRLNMTNLQKGHQILIAGQPQQFWVETAGIGGQRERKPQALFSMRRALIPI